MKAKESRNHKEAKGGGEVPKTGPSRREFLAQGGRVAAGIGAVSILGNAGQQGMAYTADESLIKRVGGTGGAKMKKQDAPQRSKEALAAAVKAELSAPIIPGEILTAAGDIEVFKGRETKDMTVKNVGDRPIQVGSHCHFFESNRALKFDREQAFGFRLAIPAGTAVRFEPGEEKKVPLVAFGGNRLAQGVNGLTEGSLDDPKIKAKAVSLAADRGFGKGGAR
ncbi:MAG: urease subunit beta [Nitrospira sp.]